MGIVRPWAHPEPCHRNADDLAAAAVGRADGLDVRHNLALDIPDVTRLVAWWAPTEWAARAKRTAALTLSSPGPDWLPKWVPADLAGRHVSRRPRHYPT